MTEEARYRRGDRIATGGMGEVWRGYDTVLQRPVAVKVLKREYAEDPRFRERFMTEARHAAALHHPNIATLYDFGEEQTASGLQPYLVMELVEGKPLSALIRPGVRMPAAQARSLVRQAAEAIAAAHAAGIVHRDVKPGNLLVTNQGQVKVTDFGIARAADQVALTSTGEVIGTPHYLSPEQAGGSAATPASDVYALGVVLYECLTGTRPFVRDTPIATALAHLRDSVPELPGDLPPDLAAITRRALAKDPAERYPDAAALAAALTGLSPAPAAPAPAAAPGGESTQVLPPVVATPPPPVEQRSARGGVVWWLLAAVAALAAVVVIVLLVNRDDNPSSEGGTASGSPSQGPSSPSTPPSSPSSSAPATHTIVESDYVGLTLTEAVAKLHRLGYDEVRNTTRPNAGDQTAGTVADIAPTGEVPVDRAIVLGVWDQPASTEPQSVSPSPTKGNKPGPGPKQKKQHHGKGKNPK